MRIKIISILFIHATIFLLFMSCSSNDQDTPSDLFETEPTDVIETVPELSAVYPEGWELSISEDMFDMYHHEVLAVFDFYQDTRNKPFRTVGNLPANLLNGDGYYRGGTVAQQGGYTYYFHANGIYRIQDDENEGQLLTMTPNVPGKVSNLNIVEDMIYYKLNSDDRMLCGFSLSGDLDKEVFIPNIETFAAGKDVIYTLEKQNISIGNTKWYAIKMKMEYGSGTHLIKRLTMKAILSWFIGTIDCICIRKIPLNHFSYNVWI